MVVWQVREEYGSRRILRVEPHKRLDVKRWAGWIPMFWWCDLHYSSHVPRLDSARNPFGKKRLKKIVLVAYQMNLNGWIALC